MSGRVNSAASLRTVATGLGLLSMITLGGCASLGGNIKGNFSCRAPDGVCAPSSAIDDRALALITSDPSAIAPQSGERSSGRGAAAADGSVRFTPAINDTRRTREKVLRIVFQPFIDEKGRLHEASAVHTVVARGEWQQEVGSDALAISMSHADVPASETLVDAVDRLGGNMRTVGADPNLPDPAAVAAARARKSDPIAAIKADVAARLAPKAESAASGLPREPSPAAPQISAPTALNVAGVSEGAPKPVVKSEGAGATAAQNSAPMTKTKSGAEAAARVAADERYVSATAQVEHQAREAGKSGAAPVGQPAPPVLVTTPPFPAAVPEGN